VPRADGPVRFQFHATWTVEVGSAFDLDPIAPRKMSQAIQMMQSRLLQQAGGTGRIGAVTVTVQQVPEYTPDPEPDSADQEGSA
jgi:hypothetical protein